MITMNCNEKNYEVSQMKGRPGRYVIVDKKTNRVLDDAQGYGYKSQESAHKGYAYQVKMAPVWKD